MNEPGPVYCGVPEHVLAAQAGNRWRKPALTFAIRTGLGRLPLERVQAVYAQAWKAWTDVLRGALLAAPAAQALGADVTAGAGAIDGPLGVLAWSHLPQGDDRPLQQLYDSAESWTEAFLLGVATHEIGHALGLDHVARNSPDLMAPIFREGVLTPQPGDVARVLALYQAGAAPPPAPPPPTPAPGAGAVKYIGSYDAQGRELSYYEVARRVR